MWRAYRYISAESIRATGWKMRVMNGRKLHSLKGCASHKNHAVMFSRLTEACASDMFDCWKKMLGPYKIPRLQFLELGFFCFAIRILSRIELQLPSISGTQTLHQNSRQIVHGECCFGCKHLRGWEFERSFLFLRRIKVEPPWNCIHSPRSAWWNTSNRTQFPWHVPDLCVF